MDTYILPFWKKLGTSSSIIAKRVSEKLNIPTSHTGTLDPLAEGVIKIIVGEDSKNKEKYISEDKTYQFKFLFGFSTDTHDALGLVTKVGAEFRLSKEEISNQVNSFLGKYHQRYPNFSSKKILGKSLWQYEREGLKVPEVFIDGEVKKIILFDFKEVDSTSILEKIREQVLLIEGNFRQEDILKKYKETNFPDKFYLIDLEVTMTRGLYVRGLARDLSDKLNYPCIILDLIRTSDGETGKDVCLNPEDYFKKEISKDKHFLSPNF